MLVPIAFEGEDVLEYAAYLGMRDHAVFGRRNPFAFIEGHNKPLQEELRKCYDMGYDLEEVSRQFYSLMNRRIKVFIRDWNDLRGWGTLEGVVDGAIKRFDFSYHDLSPDMADVSLDAGEVLTITYQVQDDKIIRITT